MAKRILITGGCGFVGHHVVEYFINNTGMDITILDKLSYASQGFDRLRYIGCWYHPRVKVICADLSLPISEGVEREIPEADYILNMASDSHVDNSIAGPADFIKNNIAIAINMLEYARRHKPKMFIHFSTDEVFGPWGDEDDMGYGEGSRLNPGNPYSASKAAQEAVCMAYSGSYQIPLCITNAANIIGERQHAEKYIPIIIKKILTGEELLIHADETLTKPGKRSYIHARDVAKALLCIINNSTETIDKFDGSIGHWNISAYFEMDNLSLAQMIALTVSKPLNYKLVDFHTARPGYDTRYLISPEKLIELGWEVPLEEDVTRDIKQVVQWSVAHKEWVL